MNATQILSADILDIIFDGRNKDYGAYELRRRYDKRLKKAMLISGVLAGMMICGFIISNENTSLIKPVLIFDFPLAPEDIKPDLPPPVIPKAQPPRPPKPVQIRTTALTQPLIVKDPPDSERPPAQDDLDDTRIGKITKSGMVDDGISPPPQQGVNGVIETPVNDAAEDNKIFRRVEIESRYPGDAPAWIRFLNKTFRYPQRAVEEGIQGTVVVEFIVDRDGSVSNVEAISGPNELREEAVRVIRKSGKWTPAVQNGRQVKSYKKQPIQFRLEAS
ncbi:MAG TPA: TonB family protein [Flavitalea sp.]|nr:TonB family protein [Flavitalea sp.]